MAGIELVTTKIFQILYMSKLGYTIKTKLVDEFSKGREELDTVLCKNKGKQACKAISRLVIKIRVYSNFLREFCRRGFQSKFLILL